jgi:hypothetical protein
LHPIVFSSRRVELIAAKNFVYRSLAKRTANGKFFRFWRGLNPDVLDPFAVKRTAAGDRSPNKRAPGYGINFVELKCFHGFDFLLMIAALN